jgi:hypothetical protein
MTTMAVAQRQSNFWTASIIAGVVTAVIAVVTALLFQAQSLVPAIIAFLLIGAGPVIGYGIASGRLGSQIGAIVAGIIGFILLPLGFLLWPILVGAVSRAHRIGTLFLASLTGGLLGIAVFLIVGRIMGQDPNWMPFAFVLWWAVWGGTCGAVMAADAEV